MRGLLPSNTTVRVRGCVGSLTVDVGEEDRHCAEMGHKP